MNAVRVMFAWVIAVVAAVTLGSIIQTQFNLASLNALGAGIDLVTRLSATGRDLLGFTPAYALLTSIAFAVAWPVAAVLKRWFPGWRNLLFPLAGFSAIWVMIAAMNSILPVTAIAATRSLAGTLALGIAGALAGWLYTKVLPEREN